MTSHSLSDYTTLTQDMIDDLPICDIHVHLPGVISPNIAWDLGMKNKLVTIEKKSNGKYQVCKYATNTFKVADIGIDSLRFVNEPTLENGNKLAVNGIQAYSMYAGYTHVGGIFTVIDVVNKLYQGKPEEADKSAGLFVLFAGASYIATLEPHIALVYYGGMATYTGYNTLSNVYGYYQEYSQEDYKLKSELAWSEVFTGICNNAPSFIKSILGYSDEVCSQIFEFYQETKETLKVVQEKLSAEKELMTKGEFESKLYKNIYEPYFELQQNLIEKVHSGKISREEADLSLQGKMVKFENPHYDICFETKVEGNEKYYYCADESQEIIDKVLLIDSEILEVLHDV